MADLTMQNVPTEGGENRLSQGTGLHTSNSVGVAQGIAIIVLASVLFAVIGISAGKFFFWNNYDKTSKIEREFVANQERVKADPNNPLNHVQLGWSYFLKGDNERAIGEYKKALAIDPKNYNAQYNMGLAYLQNQQYDRAVTCLKDAIQIVPNAFGPHLNLGISYVKLEKYEDALKELSLAYKSNPGSPETFYWKGTAYEKQGKLDLAFNEYETAINFDPNYKTAKEAYERLKKTLNK